jgi:hypothetical protein
MLDAIANWGPVKALIILGGVSAGVVAIWRIFSSLHKSQQRDRPLVLEYSSVQVIALGDKSGRLAAAKVRVFLINPEDVPLRVTPAQMRTSLGVNSAAVDLDRPSLDVAPQSTQVAVEAPALPVTMPEGSNHVSGWIDWQIEYAGVYPEQQVGRTFTFNLSGDIEIHQFSHGFESRWVPDERCLPSVLSEDLSTDEGGNLRQFVRGAPIE